METSLRYGGESKSLRICAKEKFTVPLELETHFQVYGELDTGTGTPSHLSAMIRRFHQDVSVILGAGLQYDKHGKLDYIMRGKKSFAVSNNGLVNFHVKGRYNVDLSEDKDKSSGAAELTWSILNFQKEQDVRVKVGFEVVHKVPYLQIRENNWTFNADAKGRWNVRYTL